MRVIIDLDDDAEEVEVRIKCKELTPEVVELQSRLRASPSVRRELLAKKGESEYYIPLKDILFFESSGREITLHTAKDAFVIKEKLYQLEEVLPASFIRVSKSAIANGSLVYATHRSLGTTGVIEFHDSHKQVSLSRGYYKMFSEKMEEMRR